LKSSLTKGELRTLASGVQRNTHNAETTGRKGKKKGGVGGGWGGGGGVKRGPGWGGEKERG